MARASRQQRRVEQRMEAALEQSQQQVKKLTGDKPSSKCKPHVHAPPVTNPYMRMLAKIDADNADRKK
jgi:hypothetical protein